MARYQVTIDLDVETQDLETAYTEAERLISAGASALGRATPMLTVAALVDPMPRTAMRFSVTVPTTQPGVEVSIAFDPAAERGAVIVYEESGGNAQHGADGYALTPESLRWLVRGLMAWPLDLLDDMAREDELKRRAAERRARGGK